jgi:hypothetical protein
MANFDPNKPGTAQLVVNRYDFQAHVDGANFRHTADEVDMNPAIVSGATTIQSTLNSFNDTINQLESIGQGFITVGDGYNTWAGPNSTAFAPYDPTIPSLDTILNPIFTAIYNGTPLPPDFSRIQNGGLVIIKAGTYIVKQTINVPPGITLMGEGFGTKIINATNLNQTEPPTQINGGAGYAITAFPNAGGHVQITTGAIPNLATGDIVNVYGVSGNSAANTQPQYQFIAGNVVNLGGNTTFNLTYGFAGPGLAGSVAVAATGSESGGFVLPIKPVFLIMPTDLGTLNDDAIVAGNTNRFSFVRESKITNMVIGDHFIEPPHVPDTNYTLAQNYTSSTVLYPAALIQQETSSSLILDNVLIIGRANSNLTGTAVFLNTAFPSSSTLKVTDCTIDGFAVPIIWQGNAGSNDYLDVSNSKIRAFGNYAGSGSDQNNCFIVVNDGMTNVHDNTMYGNSTNIARGVFVMNVVSGPIPALQARGKMIVSGNDIIVSKSTNTSLSFYPIEINSTLTGSILNYLSWMEYGNKSGLNMFTVTVNTTGATPAPALSVTTGGVSLASVDVTGVAVVTGLTTLGVADITTENVTTSNITTANIGGGGATITGTTTANGVFIANNSSSFAGTATFNNQIFSNSTLFSTGQIRQNLNTSISTTTYVVDSGSLKDYCMIAPTILGACVFVLPMAASNSGRILIIKDIGKASLTHSITIYTQPGEQFEAGLSRTPVGSGSPNFYGDTLTVVTPFTAITLIASIGGNWFLI